VLEGVDSFFEFGRVAKNTTTPTIRPNSNAHPNISLFIFNVLNEILKNKFGYEKAIFF
jgi:hypothetical protein